MTLVMDIIRAIRNAAPSTTCSRGHRGGHLGRRQGSADPRSGGDYLHAGADRSGSADYRRVSRRAVASADAGDRGGVHLPAAGGPHRSGGRARPPGKELADTEAQIARSEQLLAGPFAERAPANVVQRVREKQAELATRAERLRERLAELG